jgi:colanic acid/amylovoran biosynthesis glycosyltransferase
LLDQGLDVRYSLAGSGPNQDEIEAVVDELRLKEHVAFLGSLGEIEVKRLLQEADVFVLSSVGEGEAAPVSLMEAMASGLPVVCSIIGSTPRMLTDGVEGFLVQQADETGLTTALAQLAENSELRQCMGAAARRRAMASFDVRKTAGILLEAIRTTRDGCPPAITCSPIWSDLPADAR